MTEAPRFIRLILSLFVVLLAAVPSLSAGGAEEEAGGARGAYVAEQGRIIPPDEVDIASYIASIDYSYPDPPDDLGVSLYSGHRQVSIHGQEEILQIGIQGRRTPFEDLPVLNLCFLFDSSGSMSEKDKIQWAKEAFDLFLDRLRPQDILSVVTFSDEAEVLLPSTRVGELMERKELRERVQRVTAQGFSSLEAGLMAGYQQLLLGYRSEQVNRVLLVSDGLGEPERAMELVQDYRRRGISLSTISVGMNCDLKVMKNLAKRGAGSSRFISNPEKMAEIFGTDLDRMVVPIAYELDIDVEISAGVEILGTWGYEHRVSGNRIHYSLPALHHRDYETILIQVRTPEGQIPGRKELFRLKLAYSDREGVPHVPGPYSLLVDFTDSSIAAGGIADPMVLKSGTMLHTAQNLEVIGFLYYWSQGKAGDLNRLNRSSWHNTDIQQENQVESVVRSELLETNSALRANKQRCLDLAEDIKKEISNTRLRLGEDCFEEELTISKKYIEILGGELLLGQPVISRLLADEEIRSQVSEKSSYGKLEDLAEEFALGLKGRVGGRIAFFGFAAEADDSLQRRADSITRLRLAGLAGFHFIGESDIEEALERLEVKRQSLLDNELALKVGNALDADYLLVGRILEMPASVVVFGKLLDSHSGAVVSVAQTILDRED